MACIATRLMSSGAGKSGKPCDRFTAPYFIASRVISRMTDSVKRLALRETREIEGAGVIIMNQPQINADGRGLEQGRGIISPSSICVYRCKSKSAANPVVVGAVVQEW